MKKLILAILVGSLSSIGFALAEDKKEAKEVTATGKVVCAHCDLNVVSSCQKAVKTKGGKAYLLAGDKAKEFFKANKKAKKVKATGTTAKDGDNIILTATKVELATTKKKKEKKEKKES